MRLSMKIVGVAALAALAACSQSPGGIAYIEEGQPAVMLHPTLGAMSGSANTGVISDRRRGGGGTNLSSHGGPIQTAPKIYLVYWGSQWNNNDPSGEAAIQQSFFNHVGGSSWSNSVTQYCEGVPSGTVFCNGAGTPAGNNTTLGGVWFDNAAAAPSKPSQAQLAAEAASAAAHFGDTSVSAQYVINTATGNNATGFGSSYCAYHSSTTANGATISWTNMPYITDAGANCGANFINSGTGGLTDGITIVGGHEFAESVTDPQPNSGWLDGSGGENGDKCAWNAGPHGNVNLGGASFPVQSLWSNAANGNAGGCVLSF
jgi:serine protease